MTEFRMDDEGRYVKNHQLFWLIEYLKRNSELQKIRAKRIAGFVEDWPNEPGDPEDGIFFDDDRTPLFRKPQAGEVDSIISSLICGQFTGEVPEWCADGFKENGVWFQISSDETGPVVIATFRPGTPKDLIINDISLFIDTYDYNNLGNSKKSDSHYFVKDPTCDSIGIVSTISYKYITEIRYNEASNVPRALGLWLFDYIQSNNSTQANAIKELENAGYLSKLNLSPADEELRFYIRCTKACIDAKKLLPFTKKGTQRLKLVPGTQQKT
jgi:hypothetical protein